MATQEVLLLVELLGRPRAWRSGVELNLGTAMRYAVFTVLAMRANQIVSKEELIDALWGANAPRTARGSLYTYISDLRRSLEPVAAPDTAAAPTLSGSRAGYCLHLSRNALDVELLDGHQERARACRAADDTEGELAALNRALELWRGEPLAGIPGPFAELARNRLTERRLSIIERRAALALELGSPDSVLDELAGVAAEHPLREPLCGLLMRLLHRCGRPTEAFEAYRRTRDTLIEQVGAEPGAELRAVHEEIRAGAARSAKPPVRRFDRPEVFVGRQAELTRLRTAVVSLSAGRGEYVWIEGEPGLGKSALLAEGLAEHIPGCQVAAATGDELTRQLPFGVLTEAVAAAAERMDHPTGSGMDQILHRIEQLCTAGPLALVIDDIHLADAESLQALGLLRAKVTSLPLLLVTTSRPLASDHGLAALRQQVVDGGATMLSLRALTDGQVRELVTAVSTEPDPHLAELAVDETAGNPRCARWVARSSVLDDGDVRIPGTVLRDIEKHLGSLPSGIRNLLPAMALLGDRCTVAEIASTTGQDGQHIKTQLDHACRSGVLAVSADQARFQQPFLQRAIRQNLPAPARGALHQQLAERLAAAGAAPTRVAEQLLAAAAPAGPWLAGWLTAKARTLAATAPELASPLLRSAITDHRLPKDTRTLCGTILAELSAAGTPERASARRGGQNPHPLRGTPPHP